MKELLARKPVDPAFLRALTDEEMARPGCRWFHRWKRVDPDTSGVNAHYQCSQCCDRKAVKIVVRLYSVPNNPWLDGKEWDYWEKRMRTPPRGSGPFSGVPPKPCNATMKALRDRAEASLVKAVENLKYCLNNREEIDTVDMALGDALDEAQKNLEAYLADRALLEGRSDATR